MTSFIKKSLPTKLIVTIVILLTAMIISIAVIVNSDVKNGFKGAIAGEQQGKINFLTGIVTSLGKREIFIDGQGRLMAGDFNLEGDTFFVDTFKEMSGNDATIFKGNVRVSTTMRKPNGERATGTALDKGPAYDTVFVRKEMFQDEMLVQGEPFFVTIVPLLDKKGTVIGAMMNGERLAQAFEEADKIHADLIRVSGLSGLVMLLAVFIFIRRQLKPLEIVRDAAVEVANGNLNAKIAYESEDEIGTLIDALKKMVGSLREMIKKSDQKAEEAQKAEENATVSMTEAKAALAQAEAAMKEADAAKQSAFAEKEKAEKSEKEALKVKEMVEEKSRSMLQTAAELESVVNIVASASTELTAQIETSEDGARKQQDLLAGTTKAMGEMNVVVGDVSRNAATTSEVATQTRNSATEGSELVKKLIKAIEELSVEAGGIKDNMRILEQQTDAVSQIMTLISSIADQTNLLALNASIEAARAGEAGASFAVVAEEVRKLAEKTMHSTVDVGNSIRAIQESVKASSEKVDTAASLVGKVTEYATVSGDALKQIVSKADETSDQIRAIATACEEQSATTAHVSDSVININDLSNLTAQAMKMSVQAVEDLSKQAEALKQMIVKLKQA